MLSGIPLDCHPGPEGVFKEMHSRFLRTLAEYAADHGQMSNTLSSRTLIWQCGWSCAGLGDRIRGITYSLLLAIFSRRRLIIFLDGVHEGKYLHPNMIDWRDEAAYQYLRKKENTGSTFSPPFSFSLLLIKDSHGVTVGRVSHNRVAEYLAIVNSNRTNVVITARQPQAIYFNDPQPKWQPGVDCICSEVEWTVRPLTVIILMQ